MPWDDIPIIVGDVIDYFQELVLLHSYQNQTNNGGIASNNFIDSNIQAVVQPLKPNELRYLPEGVSSNDYRNIWSKSKLKSLDEFTYRSQRFTIMTDAQWDIGGFWKAQGTIVHDTT